MARTNKNSFGVICPFCGAGQDEDAGQIQIDLNNLKVLHCSECDEEFTAAQAVAKVRQQLAAWEAVARWVESAPAAMRGETEAEGAVETDGPLSFAAVV